MVPMAARSRKSRRSGSRRPVTFWMPWQSLKTRAAVQRSVLPPRALGLTNAVQGAAPDLGSWWSTMTRSTPRGEPGGLVVRSGAAVEGDNERRLLFGENTVESVAAQSVAFGFAQREEPSGLESERGEETVQDGERGYTIDVIVAVEDDVFSSFDGEGDAAGGVFQSGCVERIGQRGEARVEEVFGFTGIVESAGNEERGEQDGNAEFAGELLRDGGIGGIPRFPARRQHGRNIRAGGTRWQCEGICAAGCGAVTLTRHGQSDTTREKEEG